MKEYKQILILGGYGNTGRPLAEYLLRETAVDLVLAGRNLDQAQETASQFNEQFADQRVSTAFADAAKPISLRQAFAAVDMVIVASSTAVWTQNVAVAALESGIDYLDVQYSRQKTAILQAMSAEIAAAGCCFITDGGFHPGLPAALIRYAASFFDHLTRANVGSVIKINWPSLHFGPETMAEFVSEFLDMQMLVFSNGRWQQTGLMSMMKPATMDFGGEFGRQYCVPMFLEEMRAVPEMIPGIEETGFFVGGFNWFTDWLISPLVMLGLKVAPQRGLKPMGRLFLWSLNRFSRPPYGTMLKLEAQGFKDEKPHRLDVTLVHEDGYVFTAVPVVATILQLLDGSIRQSGLHWQAHIVEPTRLLQDMERMGIACDLGIDQPVKQLVQ